MVRTLRLQGGKVARSSIPHASRHLALLSLDLAALDAQAINQEEKVDLRAREEEGGAGSNQEDVDGQILGVS